MATGWYGVRNLQGAISGYWPAQVPKACPKACLFKAQSLLFPLREQRLFMPRAEVAGAAYLLPATRRRSGAGCGKKDPALNRHTAERQTD